MILKEENMLKEKLTILVCSCDKYEDLWNPFFTLLKKYCSLHNVRILLNTESLCFSFDNLHVECIHSPGEKRYGQRMLNALAQVKTEYMLLLMDDFFLREPVDLNMIDQIIEWMESDRKIACFNFEATKAYSDWECDVYPGFRRLPPGNKFTLNMQAAIWRTSCLQKYWRPDVSPWEWEAYCNVLTIKHPGDKFYCAKDRSDRYINYGHYQIGDLWGVVKGKWIIEDVQPLFEREGIEIDFSKRGNYIESQSQGYFPSLDTRKDQFDTVFRCLGKRLFIQYFFFRIRCKVEMKLRKKVDINYFAYLMNRAQTRFLMQNQYKEE